MDQVFSGLADLISRSKEQEGPLPATYTAAIDELYAALVATRVR